MGAGCRQWNRQADMAPKAILAMLMCLFKAVKIF